jgi:hypothetical protein
MTANNNDTQTEMIWVTSTNNCGLRNSSDIIEKTLIYPNPTSNFITIESSEQFIALYNVHGEVLNNNLKQNGQINNLNLSSCPNGVYFLKTKDGELIKTYKIIKQ